MKKTVSRKHERAEGARASQLIDQRISDLGDWRGETLARMRTLIREADPEMVEEWKWMGTPVWSHDGNVCTGETYKQVVKLTFARGASLPDPAGLFNSSLDGNVRRAIDIREGERVDGRAFKALIKAAVALNGAPTRRTGPKSGPKTGTKTGAKTGTKTGTKTGAESRALPGWKQDLARRLDAVIGRGAARLTHATDGVLTPGCSFVGQPSGCPIP